MTIDESLVQQRLVQKVSPDQDGGWTVDLACGHSIWCAVPPDVVSYCGICAQKLIRQIRELCAQQSPPPYRVL